jgi:hypothetical protein
MSLIKRSATEESILLPPVVFDLEGCKVYIWNIVSYTTVSGARRYFVSFQLEYMGYLSRRAFVDVANEPELMSMLKKEIVLFKSIVLSGSYGIHSRG